MLRSSAFAAAAAMALVTAPAYAQVKWDLPSAYPADNFHSENLAAFARDVADVTGGKLAIKVYPNASLFPATAIKSAVRIGQAQVGEILISVHEDEDPMFGIDVVPFLAASYDEARKLWAGVEARDRAQACGAGVDGAVRGAVAAAGHLREEGDQCGRRYEGAVLARVQRRHRAHRADRRRLSRDHPGRRPAAGARDRPDQRLHDLERDRLRHQGMGDHDLLLRHAGLDSEERHLREQGGVRPARQADAGVAAQGRRRGRSARLVAVAGQDQMVRRTAGRPRHEGPAAERGR